MNAHAESPCYLNGRPYRPLCARLDPISAFSFPDFHVRRSLSEGGSFSPASLGWTAFWQHISTELLARHYTEGTRAQYRTILRSFYRHARRLPAATDETLIQSYLSKLTQAHYSWSWIGMNISVLRTVFDKLAGCAITRHFVTPKRPYSLPEILSLPEIHALLHAADTTRDQLLLGLLYGCGLKIGELRRLTWGHIETGHLHISQPRGEIRTLEIPADLLPVLDYGKKRCPTGDYIFQGRTAGTPLSARMIELIIRRASHAAGILKPVTAMTLRHTYAVHCLENGQNIRELQQALGHEHIKTTMQYTRSILPVGLESPLDPIKRRQRQAKPQTISAFNFQLSTFPSAPLPPPAFPIPIPVPISAFNFQLSAFPSAPLPPPAFPIPIPVPISAFNFQLSAFPSAPLFPQPLSIESLELPFPRPEGNPAVRFYQLIKTLLTGRFLSHHRTSKPSG